MNTTHAQSVYTAAEQSNPSPPEVDIALNITFRYKNVTQEMVQLVIYSST